MLSCFAEGQAGARPVHVLRKDDYAGWLASAPAPARAPGSRPLASRPSRVPAPSCRVPGATSPLPCCWSASGPVCGMQQHSATPCRPASGSWTTRNGSCLFARRRSAGLSPPTASAPIASWRPHRAPAGRRSRRLTAANRMAEAIYLARDLINTPAGPRPRGAGRSGGRRRPTARGHDRGHRRRRAAPGQLPGDPHRRRASTRAPRLADLRWGDPSAPRLTLVGKGVCFDTGGLDIKPSAGMLLMKKDMGGAAIMLALARLVMEHAFLCACASSSPRSRTASRATLSGPAT